MNHRWAVFPCRPRGKEPWAKYAPHGHNSATSNPAMWVDVPRTANWGVNCAKSGLVVIDIDHDEIPDYCPPTYTVRTGRGWHLYYKAEPGDTYVGKLGEQIDIKHNGYVIAAGGTHPDGHLYELKDGREPVALTKKLRELLTYGRTDANDSRSSRVSRRGAKHNLGLQTEGANASTGSTVRSNPTMETVNNQGLAEEPTRVTFIVTTPGGKKYHIASKAVGREDAYLLCGPLAKEYTVIDQAESKDLDVLRKWALSNFTQQLCGSCRKHWNY